MEDFYLVSIRGECGIAHVKAFRSQDDAERQAIVLQSLLHDDLLDAMAFRLAERQCVNLGEVHAIQIVAFIDCKPAGVRSLFA